MTPPDNYNLELLSNEAVKLMERGDESPVSTINICRYCDQEFKCVKAFVRHLEIHINRLTGENMELFASSSHLHSQEDDDAITSDNSSQSMKKLRKLYEKAASNYDIKQATPSDESSSLLREEGIGEVCAGDVGSQIDLLKYTPNWSATGKRGKKKIASEKTDNIIYDAVPLRFAMPTMKKRKSEEETVESQPGADSVNFSENNMPMMPKVGFESRISNDYKLKKPKRAKAVNGVHQCEICGKTFPTGQALGGHKTYHRADPLKGVENAEAGDGFRRMLLRMPGEEAHPSAQSNQQVPKKMHDFDLNMPCSE